MAESIQQKLYRAAIGKERNYVFIQAKDEEDLIRFLVREYVGKQEIFGASEVLSDGSLHTVKLITNPLFAALSEERNNLLHPYKITVTMQAYRAGKDHSFIFEQRGADLGTLSLKKELPTLILKTLRKKHLPPGEVAVTVDTEKDGVPLDQEKLLLLIDPDYSMTNVIPINEPFASDISSVKQPPFTECEKKGEKAVLNTYILIEEQENGDGIRNFSILGVSPDRDSLRRLMEAKIAKDEDGYIMENGILEDYADYFSTNFGDTFVSYSIIETPILTRENIDALLETAAYSSVMQFPDNLRDLLMQITQNTAEARGYGTVDAGKATDAILEDQNFHLLVKQAWWGDCKLLTGTHEKVALRSCEGYVNVLLDEDPDWFEKIGAREPFEHPDNLRRILIDSIYSVACAYRLPVQNVEEQADGCMRNSEFRSAIQNSLSGIRHLKEDHPKYSEAYHLCSHYVRKQLALTMEDMKLPLEDQIKDASRREQGRGEAAAPTLTSSFPSPAER